MLFTKLVGHALCSAACSGDIQRLEGEVGVCS